MDFRVCHSRLWKRLSEQHPCTYFYWTREGLVWVVARTCGIRSSCKPPAALGASAQVKWAGWRYWPGILTLLAVRV